MIVDQLGELRHRLQSNSPAMIIGYAAQKLATRRLDAWGKEVKASGGPPAPEQLAEIQVQQKKLSQDALWTAVLLAVSVAGMALSAFKAALSE
jgi:hypothetical protein